ncbi:hypothetical protein LOTGIDRAFT_237276 [Lottia gigantea]|uniref:Uncharacterized protein n=1 Tax=Lottia gigantea TaxID=225164 RepID=V4BB25_LOTGI|nr:hypothetical protein LOTGIDRAFT_237276 [Lottia gigantea]ESP04746.1 hypothetical protein LOTGIDRAFT_237276 [Lottia gigantea]
MDNVCYGNGTIYNTGNREFVCKADGISKAWHPLINGTVTDNGMVEDEIDAVAIGISVAVVVVIIIVVSLIIVCVRKRRNSKKPYDVPSPATNPAFDSRGEVRTDNTYDSMTVDQNNHIYTEITE